MTDEIRARLTARGSPFEIAWEDVLGERMQVFHNRLRSLRELLAASIAHEDREHLVCGDRRISFAAHVRQVASTAHGLSSRFGVGPGDRVAIVAANSPDWVIAFWAAVSLGASVAALNGWWSGPEISSALAHCEPKLILGDRARLARVDRSALGAPVVEMESDFAALREQAPDASLSDAPIAEDDPAVLLYTSGTTGRPHAAICSHRGILGYVQTNLLAGAERAVAAAAEGSVPPPAPQHCSLVTVPLFHMSGLFACEVMGLAIGAKNVYRSGRFDPEDVLRLIESERVTQWSALGSSGPRVIEHPRFAEYDVTSVTRVGFGGAPTSPELLRRIRAAFPNAADGIGLGYGLSEAVAPATIIGGSELRDHPESVGRPLATTRLEIRDPEGLPVAIGAEGEIYIRSPYLMRGYWRDSEATAKVLRPGRWLASGDIGRLDLEGRLYVNTRARDLILRGGENVYPPEIEHRLDAHPSVEESAVLGVPHPELGQEVGAVIVPTEGATIDTDALASWVGERLAAFKVPTQWKVQRTPLPRNAAGKVVKTVLTGAAQSTLVEE